MFEKFVFLKLIDVYDDKVFTKERCQEWKDHMFDVYEDTYRGLVKKLGAGSLIEFFINKPLVDEVVVDAVVGMRKIVDSQYTAVENPNAFKIISYLSYWWLRHKPVSIHYPLGFNLNSIDITGQYEDEKGKEYARQKLIWQLKHINEIVAVQMVATYIFDFEKVLCDKKQCESIKKKEVANFCFDSFDEMKEALLKKLTYYFAYRALAPKMIEHTLEGYSFHPAWGLTGPQWAIAKEEGILP